MENTGGCRLVSALLRRSACAATIVVGYLFHTNRVLPFVAWEFVRSAG